MAPWWQCFKLQTSGCTLRHINSKRHTSLNPRLGRLDIMWITKYKLKQKRNIYLPVINRKTTNEDRSIRIIKVRTRRNNRIFSPRVITFQHRWSVFSPAPLLKKNYDFKTKIWNGIIEKCVYLSVILID